MYQETHARSIAKALSWRVSGTVATAAIVFGFTQRITLALAVGGLEAVGKTAVYFWHERLWNRVRFGRREIKPAVIWLTGLSGAGKSTIAAKLCEELRARKLRVEHFDGDRIRDIFPNTGFTRAERDAHIKRVGHLASILERNGVFVVASFVSPYREAREFARSLCRSFIEIHVATPLAECERRDEKGLYARARKGEIQNFTGISDPYEEPLNPEIRVNTAGRAIDETMKEIMAKLKSSVGV